MGGNVIPAHDQSHVVCEIETLKGTDTPDNIARRVGFPNRRALARQLSRWGRGDLAAIFEKLVSTSGGSEETPYL